MTERREWVVMRVPSWTAALARERSIGARLDAFLKAITANVDAPIAKLCSTVLSGALGLTVRHGAAVTNPIRGVVFPSAAGTLRDPGSVRKQLTKVLKTHGLAWVSPHTLRRTVATVVDAATETRPAADQLGHAGTEATERYYIQRINDGPDVRAGLDAFVVG